MYAVPRLGRVLTLLYCHLFNPYVSGGQHSVFGNQLFFRGGTRRERTALFVMSRSTRCAISWRATFPQTIPIPRRCRVKAIFRHDVMPNFSGPDVENVLRPLSLIISFIDKIKARFTSKIESFAIRTATGRLCGSTA